MSYEAMQALYDERQEIIDNLMRDLSAWKEYAKAGEGEIERLRRDLATCWDTIRANSAAKDGEIDRLSKERQYLLCRAAEADGLDDYLDRIDIQISEALKKVGRFPGKPAGFPDRIDVLAEAVVELNARAEAAEKERDEAKVQLDEAEHELAGWAKRWELAELRRRQALSPPPARDGEAGAEVTDAFGEAADIEANVGLGSVMPPPPAIDPKAPRPFRWPDSSRDGEWRYGVYWTQNGTSDTGDWAWGGLPVKNRPDAEWVSPPPQALKPALVRCLDRIHVFADPDDVPGWLERANPPFGCAVCLQTEDWTYHPAGQDAAKEATG
jgi:hypothetical protein